MITALDAAAQQLRRSRADVIRLAVEHYLEDFDDLSVAIDRLRDPSDPVLDWDKVRRDLPSDADEVSGFRIGNPEGACGDVKPPAVEGQFAAGFEILHPGMSAEVFERFEH